MKNWTALFGLLILVIITGACGVPENEVRKREQASYSRGWTAGETSGAEKERSICKDEKIKIQTENKVERDNAVSKAVQDTRIENTTAITGGFIGGVVISVVGFFILMLVGAIGVLIAMFMKRDDPNFNDFWESLKFW